MNDLYASYPSNRRKEYLDRLRAKERIESHSKDPLKTFIGGLVIGTVIGASLVSAFISHILL